MKIVAFVPIKLNSQRLPHKNILPINGKPLCWYVPSALSQVSTIDEVYVFCSDENVKNYIPSNVTFLERDKRLDQDEVKGEEIYKAFLKQVEADIYVLAHTTSPFLKVSTIENALQKVASGKNDSAFTAKKIQTFAWYKNKPINYDLSDIPRTQDIETVYIETSGFYIFSKELFEYHNRRIGFSPYIQEVDIFEEIDIDTEEDYKLACLMAERRTNGSI